MLLFSCCCGEPNKSDTSRRGVVLQGSGDATTSSNGVVLPTRQTASVKTCLGIEHYSFIKDFSTLNYLEAVTPSHATSVAGGAQRSSRSSATPVPPPASDSCSGAETSDVLLCVSPYLPYPMRRPKWTSDDYLVLDQIHKGHSSTVFKVCTRVPRGAFISTGDLFLLATVSCTASLCNFLEVLICTCMPHMLRPSGSCWTLI